MTNPKNPAFKLMIVGRRRAEMTLAQHRHHILEKHGKIVLELIASHPDHAPRKYAQNRVVDGTWRSGGSVGDPFALTRDFVTQVWFDNPAQAADALSHPLYKANLQPDEDRFVDQASVVKLAVREQIVVASPSKTGAVKVFAFFSKLNSIDPAGFATAWQHRGHELIASIEAKMVQRYIQNQVMSRPGEAPWADAIDEFWVNDLAAASALVEAVHTKITAPLLADGYLAQGSAFHLIAEESLLFAGAGVEN